MDTVFAPNDTFYTAAAITWALLNYVLFPRILPRSVRRVLNIPAMLLHEFAHWLIAYGMVGFPRVNFREGIDDEGGNYTAYVRWKFNWFGRVGNAIVSIAPFAGGLALAAYIAICQFSVEQPFWHAVGWVALFCWCIEAANMMSSSDFKGLGFIGKILFWYFLFNLLLLGFAIALEWGNFFYQFLLKPHILEWLADPEHVALKDTIPPFFEA